MQPTPSWTLARISSHYLLGISPELRRRWELRPGEMVYLRDLGAAALLVPLKELPQGHLSDAEMDTAALRLVSTAERPLSSAPLPTAAPVATAAPAPRGAALTERLAYVNKKGFLNIPDDIKAALGLAIDASFICEVLREESGTMCLVIRTVKSMAEVLEFQKMANERDAVRTIIAKVKVEQAQKALEVASPAAQIEAPWTIDGDLRQAASPPAVTAPPWALKPKPTEEPIAGHVWHQHTDGSWVQVPDMGEES